MTLLEVLPQASSLVLVVEFMRSDLSAVLNESERVRVRVSESARPYHTHMYMLLTTCLQVLRRADKPLTDAQVKTNMLMLLKGVAYMHSNDILHRVHLHTHLQANTVK